ncbi:phospholipase A1-like [Thrips palmi]|uniref:Phospholipase A1-like n=1 Tax=Thrips palmi TaxID=161013 RepID=A0A6P8ZGK9_THRPL|nr:phospholipase A1-like [Thrips palmi]
MCTLAFFAVAVLAAATVAAPGRAPSGQLVGQVGDALLQAELRAWKAAGQPDFVHFPDDKGEPVLAAIVGDQSVKSVKGFLPTADDIKFHLFTQQNDTDLFGQEFDLNVTSLLAAGFNTRLPTKVITHGFTNTIESPIIQEIKNAYLGSGAFNVIGVDWGALCPAPLYFTSRVHVPVAGTRVGEMLTVMVQGGILDTDDLHLIGHSLGAHVSGLAGKKLFQDTGKRPKRITGLDPAYPLFIVTPEENRLYKGDADTVDVIHTCAGFLGFSDALGTSDFFPNGGSDQPGCGVDLTGVCSHARSYKYFAESIVEGKGYQAVYCESDKDAWNGACTTQEDGCMGEKVYFKETGSYYLTTSENAGPTLECQLSQ